MSSKLSEKTLDNTLPASSVYLHVLDANEGSAANQDKRTEPNGGLLALLASTPKVSSASSSGNAITLALGSALNAVITTTLAEDIDPGGITISGLRTGGGYRHELWWVITASGADRTVPATAFPSGTNVEGWDETISTGSIRWARLQTIDDGTTWRLTSNSPLSAFAGEGTTGVVPDPVSETNAVLRDDGSWIAHAASVFGRSGTVVAVEGDYTAKQVACANVAMVDTNAFTAANSGAVHIVTGTTPTINLDTGLQAYSAANPLHFAVINRASGNCTVAGSATPGVRSTKTAVIQPGGYAYIRQYATDSYTMDGALVDA